MSDTKERLREIHSGSVARERLYEESRRDLLPVLARLIPATLQPRWSAEDLFHEVFLKALERLDGFDWRGDASWRSYLLTIARNCVRDALRRRSRLDVRFRGSGDRGGIRPSGLVDPSTRLSSVVARLDLLESLLGRLAADDAALLRLRMLEGLSNAEAAARLGRSEEALKKATQRAMSRLVEAARGMLSNS